jgi:hypothetical protein
VKRRLIIRLRIMRQIIQTIFCSVGLEPAEHARKKYRSLLQIGGFLMQSGQHIDWTKVVETISCRSILSMDKRSLFQSFQLDMVPTQRLFNAYRVRFKGGKTVLA